MNRIRAALMSVAVIGIVVAGAPAASAKPADPTGAAATADRQGAATVSAYVPKSQRTAGAAAADGRFWVWEHSYFSGRGCGYRYNHQDYRDSYDCGDMDNIASSVHNNGWVHRFDDVRMYRDYLYSGPSMCLGLGDKWADLDLGWERFTNGEHANDKISSHIWAYSCP